MVLAGGWGCGILGVVLGLLSSLGGFEFLFVFVLWLGSCFVLGCWVWDWVCENVMFKWVASSIYLNLTNTNLMEILT